MVRSKSVVAMVLLGVLLGSGSLAAQKPSYSSRGDKALQALDWDVLWGRKPGDWAQTIAAFESATRGGNGKDWCTDAFFLGFAYYTSGRLPEAIAAFDDLFNSADKLNCDTQGLLPAWHHYRGKAYNKSGQYKEAAASFAKALNLAPKERPADFWPKWWFRGILPTKEVCYSWLASAQSESGAYQESAGSYKKEIELNPTDGGPYSGLADALIHLKQYDDALAAAKRGIELKPNWYAYTILGDLHAARKQYAEAIDARRKAIETEPQAAGLYSRLGHTLAAKEDYDGAVAAYGRAAGLDASEPDYPYEIAATHALAGKFDQAVASLDKAIGMVTRVGIGARVAIENGQPVLRSPIEGPAKEAGLKAGDRLVMIDRQSTKGWDLDKTLQVLRGEEHTQVVLRIQRQGEAKPFEAAIPRELIIPKAAARYYGLRSLVAREQGHREGAVKDADLAYSLNPDGGFAREALGAVSLDRGKYAEAIKLLTGMKDPFAHILEATACAKQNDLAQAVEIYTNIPEEELLVDDAPRRNARNALLQTLQSSVQERLAQARASESAGRSMEALADYAEALKVADDTTAELIRQDVASLFKDNPYLTELPEEARKHALRGDVLIETGEFTDARTEYRTAVKLAPFNPQLHYNTALIHGQLKDYRAAVKSMNVYLRLSPDAPNARAAHDQVYKWEFALENVRKR